MMQVLKNYPGAMIIIFHDKEFLERIGINITHGIENGKIKLF